jgi:hypothetical protein
MVLKFKWGNVIKIPVVESNHPKFGESGKADPSRIFQAIVDHPNAFSKVWLIFEKNFDAIYLFYLIHLIYLI